jgi:transcriptional regulator with XRE-family HTH domain
MSQMHNGHSALEFDLTDRLRKAMRISGHTNKTLGDALGVHRNSINNYLSGRSPVDRRTLIAWSFACGVPLEWLEKGTAPRPNDGPEGGAELPRLDSNQQPSGYMFAQVTPLYPLIAA